MTQEKSPPRGSAEQVRRVDNSFARVLASVIEELDNLDTLDGEALNVCFNESQKPRDIEFKDAVRIKLVVSLGGTGLKGFVECELATDHGFGSMRH